MKKGADINKKNKDGKYLLNIATEKENLILVKFLVKNGANVN